MNSSVSSDDVFSMEWLRLPPVKRAPPSSTMYSCPSSIATPQTLIK